MEITKSTHLSGDITVPGDKSISHRGIMFGAIADGITELSGFLDGADCRSTISCFRNLGISIQQDSNQVRIYGKGLHGLSAPVDTLDVGNSGTTMRLISGILSGCSFSSTLNGDTSIQQRPMNRIITPLTMMGADITALKDNGCAPLRIQGGHLHSISYDSPVASAQVKSAILLAGLYCDGITSVTEPVLSRNHTELMLRGFGAKVTSEGCTASIVGHPTLHGQQITIPGDISSAAYFIAAALIVPHASLMIRNVNCNPTRDGIIKVARQMGGKITFENQRVVSGEEVCDLVVTSSSLHGVTIGGDIIPTLIDEIPMIAVMAAYASGDTIIRDAAELKVKESNRIDSVVQNLQAMGVDATATSDGMIIHGGRPLHGAHIITHSDHRIDMSFSIAAIAADGTTTLDDADCIAISYPQFFDTLHRICS